jgi:predicted alpha/beta-fold hydrolase
MVSPGGRIVLTLQCLLTTASALVLCSDTLYVLEYGRHYGLSLLAVSFLLSLSVSKQYSLRTLKLVLLVGGFVLAMALANPGGIARGILDDSEACHVPEGLYYHAENPDAQRLVDHFSPQSYRYDLPPGGSATPWMPTGDSRTGLPFLLHHINGPRWVRLWLPVTDDDGFGEEVVALDVSFPDPHDGGHNGSMPLYLVLHGLSGGSQEEYIKDFAVRRNREGSTVVVMVARGLMDLPVRGMNLFHGARHRDVHAAAMVLRSALDAGAADSRQLLAGVGYSMGGIIMANYVSRLGPDCALDVAVSISGGLDMRYETKFTRAQRLWQPILTQTLRNVFVAGKWGERVRRRLSKKEMKEMLRAYHITEIDKTAVVAYNGFRDLDHYYSEMSALGDTLQEFHEENDEISRTSTLLAQLDSRKRLQNLSIPLLVVHALDDPLISWRTVAANRGLMRPEHLVRWVPSGKLLILLTKRGGHVGWPLGLNPSNYKWKWMNDVAMSFVEAYRESRIG